MNPREFLLELFRTAVDAALPRPSWFDGLEAPRGRLIVVGAGKAAASMARAFELSGLPIDEGLVVTRYGHSVPTSKIEVVEAAHPVPDQAGIDAAKRILSMVQGLSEDDLVVALISGGGSSLLTLPAPGISLEQKQAVTRELLNCGATISEINSVRKRLSAIKGGRLLAAASPARVVTYAISDVPGDDVSTIASGPTVPDRTPPGFAMAVVRKYKLNLEDVVLSALSKPTPDLSGARSEIHIVASAMRSLEAVAARAREQGVDATIVSDRIEGEAREVAIAQAELVLKCAESRVFLSGGETTVTVRGRGRGGRNVEFLAALARKLDGYKGIWALAADTDGVDGVEPVAGAIIDPTTVARAGDLLDEALENNDAHTLFERLGDQVVTGPTLTNVNDFRAILRL